MKQFSIDGVEYEQLASFIVSIQSQRFRFIVLNMHGDVVLVLREARRCVGKIDQRSINEALGDYVVAAKSRLESLIAHHGVARVRSVLAGA